jgi:hypothetical protein
MAQKSFAFSDLSVVLVVVNNWSVCLLPRGIGPDLHWRAAAAAAGGGAQ